MTPEGDVKDEITKELLKRGAHIFMPVQYGYGKRAVDFVVCLNGRYVAIEAKRADCPPKPTRLQLDFLRKTRAAGGVGVVAQSWADVEAAL